MSRGYPGPQGGRDFDDVHLAAMHLRSMQWSGDNDPLKRLFVRLHKEHESEDAIVTQQKIYALTTAALRATLAGRTIQKIQDTEVDWGDDGDRVKEGTRAHKAKLSRAQRAPSVEPAIPLRPTVTTVRRKKGPQDDR